MTNALADKKLRDERVRTGKQANNTGRKRKRPTILTTLMLLIFQYIGAARFDQLGPLLFGCVYVSSEGMKEIKIRLGMELGLGKRGFQLGVDFDDSMRERIQHLVAVGRLDPMLHYDVSSDATACMTTILAKYLVDDADDDKVQQPMVAGFYVGRSQDAQRGVLVYSQSQIRAVLESFGVGDRAQLMNQITVYYLAPVGLREDPENPGKAIPLRPIVLAAYGHDSGEKAGDHHDINEDLITLLKEEGIKVTHTTVDNDTAGRQGTQSIASHPPTLAKMRSLGTPTPHPSTVSGWHHDHTVAIDDSMERFLSWVDLRDGDRSTPPFTTVIPLPPVVLYPNIDFYHVTGRLEKKVLKPQTRARKVTKKEFNARVKEIEDGLCSESQWILNRQVKLFDVSFGVGLLHTLLDLSQTFQDEAPLADELVTFMTQPLSTIQAQLAGDDVPLHIRIGYEAAISKNNRETMPTVAYGKYMLEYTTNPSVTAYCKRLFAVSTSLAARSVSGSLEGAAELDLLFTAIRALTLLPMDPNDCGSAEEFFARVTEGMTTISWMNDNALAQGFDFRSGSTASGMGFSEESMTALEMNYSAIEALLQEAGAYPEAFFRVQVHALASQVCEQLFGILRTMAGMMVTRARFNIAEGERKINDVILLREVTDRLAETAHIFYQRKEQRRSQKTKVTWRTPGLKVLDHSWLTVEGMSVLAHMGESLALARMHKAVTKMGTAATWLEIEKRVVGCDGNSDVSTYSSRCLVAPELMASLDTRVGRENEQFLGTDWPAKYAMAWRDAYVAGTGSVHGAFNTTRPQAYIVKRLAGYLPAKDLTNRTDRTHRRDFVPVPEPTDGMTAAHCGRASQRRATLPCDDGRRRSIKEILKALLTNSALTLIGKGASDNRERYSRALAKALEGEHSSFHTHRVPYLPAMIQNADFVLLYDDENRLFVANISAITTYLSRTSDQRRNGDWGRLGRLILEEERERGAAEATESAGSGTTSTSSRQKRPRTPNSNEEVANKEGSKRKKDVLGNARTPGKKSGGHHWKKADASAKIQIVKDGRDRLGWDYVMDDAFCAHVTPMRVFIQKDAGWAEAPEALAAEAAAEAAAERERDDWAWQDSDEEPSHEEEEEEEEEADDGLIQVFPWAAGLCPVATARIVAVIPPRAFKSTSRRGGGLIMTQACLLEIPELEDAYAARRELHETAVQLGKEAQAKQKANADAQAVKDRTGVRDAQTVAKETGYTGFGSSASQRSQRRRRAAGKEDY